MPKYSIWGVVSADKHLGYVEADSAKEAIEKAWNELDCNSPTICHQCSKELNINDVYKLIAENADGSMDIAESE